MAQNTHSDALKSVAVENVLRAQRYLDDALRDLGALNEPTLAPSRAKGTIVGAQSDTNLNRDVQTEQPTATDSPTEVMQTAMSPSQKSALTSRIILTYVKCTVVYFWLT